MPEFPWLSQYDPEVPHSLEPYPSTTLLDVVRESAREEPDAPALLFKGRALSWRELDRASDAFAAALAADGVQSGDRVALLLPNCPQAVIAQLGVWKSGAIVCAMNPLYTQAEIEHGLREIEPAVAVVLTPFYEKVAALKGATSLRRVIAANIKEYLPPVLKVLFTVVKERREGHRIAIHQEDRWFQDLLTRHAEDPAPGVTLTGESPALLLFTGGTTGTPKAALGRHGALLKASLQLQAWFSPLLRPGDVITAVFPLFHVAGNVAILGTALVGRHPVALVPNPRDLDDLLATVEKTKAAFLPGVPTLFNALMNHPKVVSGKASLASVKISIAGSAALLGETKRRFEELTGGRMLEVYSLTEAMMAALGTPVNGEFRSGAVGVPLPDVEVRITDEAGNVLPPGEVGEIRIRAPQLMDGYWRRPRETAETLVDGWLLTGDLAHMDEDGYVYISDRAKDLIKTSGFQVWPREVEEAIATLAGVAETSVAGVPDAHQGEAVHAWIVLQPDARLDPEQVRDHCRVTLAAYKVPRHVAFRDSLPKSTVGKVLRRVLVEETVEAARRDAVPG